MVVPYELKVMAASTTVQSIRGTLRFDRDPVTVLAGIDPRPPSSGNIPASPPGPSGSQVNPPDTSVAPPTEPHKPRLPFPEPTRSPDPIVGDFHVIDGIGTALLKVEADRQDQRQDGPYCPMAVTSDGKLLYLLDGSGALHRINLETLRAEAVLQTGHSGQAIAISSEGVLIGLRSARAIWVVDAQTLRVKREIPVTDVSCVASAPTLSIGYVATKGRFQVLDLKKGYVSHDVRTGIRGQGGAAQSALSSLIVSMEVSRDGRYLFAASDAIHRFRIYGERLIHEESTTRLTRGHPTGHALSPDGRWIALPAGDENSGADGRRMPVFDSAQLGRAALTLSTGAHPCAIGFDPKTGRMYVPDYDKMNVFSPRGRLQRQARLGFMGLRKIIALPIGERYIVWARGRIAVCDLQPKRLSELLKAE